MTDAGGRWALETFGRYGLEIRSRIPDLVRQQHLFSADAQEASRQRNRGVYGNVWRGVLESFEDAFGGLPGAQMVQPGRAPYRVPMINNVALYPWRYGRNKESDLEQTLFGSSDARLQMTDLPVVTIQPALPIEVPLPTLSPEEQEIVNNFERAMFEALEVASRLVVVAFSSSTIGLHDLQWGDAHLGTDGCIEFGFQETLLPLTAGARPASTSPTKTFTSGDVPSRFIKAKEDVPSDG